MHKLKYGDGSITVEEFQQFPLLGVVGVAHQRSVVGYSRAEVIL